MEKIDSFPSKTLIQRSNHFAGALSFNRKKKYKWETVIEQESCNDGPWQKPNCCTTSSQGGSTSTRREIELHMIIIIMMLEKLVWHYPGDVMTLIDVSAPPPSQSHLFFTEIERKYKSFWPSFLIKKKKIRRRRRTTKTWNSLAECNTTSPTDVESRQTCASICTGRTRI